MTQHFNGLTPAEAERLAILAEEAAEVIQVVGKILRHGYESRKPSEPNGPTNRDALAREMGDFGAIANRLFDAGDVTASAVRDAMSNKEMNIKRYLHHQIDAAHV